ncbi:hypothetical protein MTBPR1_80163 [Candidatus Terasakiella magnetica]|uniref:Uncharacterized protein n=1 Tax=Candidatus Terasakiella magnetica TaxID=1867952 RepID=A0A1C3RLT7_9PROT|nr:hypothetical protein [Candidatus Terasakiella magnetica]SCA58109.1 hypothetical protein MTBPR1_80163 [Candidatus Terasakiella magnetica]
MSADQTVYEKEDGIHAQFSFDEQSKSIPLDIIDLDELIEAAQKAKELICANAH